MTALYGERVVQTVLGLLFLGVALVSSPAAAQVQSPVFDWWTTEDGLPAAGITDIKFGPGGFLYLTTFDGLLRFDGTRFKRYSVSSHPNLPSNRFVAMAEGPTDEVWVLTEQFELARLVESDSFVVYSVGQELPRPVDYVQAYDAETDTHFFGTAEGIVRIQGDQVVSILPELGEVDFLRKTRNRGLLIGARGETFLYQEGRLETLGPLDPDAISLNVLEDSAGRFWATAPQPLVYDDGRWQVRPLPGGASPVRTYPDDTGTIWTVGSDGALYRQKGSELERANPQDLPTLPADASCDGPPVLASEHRGLLTGLTHCLDGYRGLVGPTEGPDGAVWGATPAGLFRLRSSPVHSPAGGIETTSAYTVLRDSQKRFWVGSFELGLECQGEACPAIPEIVRSPTLALDLDPEGRVWGATADQLWQYEAGDFRVFQIPRLTGFSRALKVHRSGEIWLGTEAGLQVGRIRGGVFEAELYRTELSHPWVRVIRFRENGEVWLGTNGGGVLRATRTGTGLAFQAITTRAGLCSDNVRDILETSPGVLWLATEDRGLCRLDTGTMEVASVTMAQGLFDDALHNIVPDYTGRWWIGSNRGLFMVDAAEVEAVAAGTSERVYTRAFTERDGLASSELNGGVQPSAWEDESGTLWFASQGGVIRAEPSTVGAASPPRPYILEVEGQSRPSRPITLAPDERDFRVGFSAVYFGAPQDLTFRYRLTGYDDTWLPAQDAREATFTNLSPGSYRFEVQAGQGGNWSVPAVLEITRRPFFFQTRWFLAMMFLTAIGIVATAFRHRVQRLEKRAQDLQARVDAATEHLQEANERLVEAGVAKDRFFANVSHELRTPLTLIQGPLNEIIDREEGLSDTGRKHLGLMERNAARLMRMINQLLDGARGAALEKTLQAETVDLVTLAAAQINLFSSKADLEGVKLDLEADDPELPWAVDLDKMEQVLSNLLSNALRYTPSGGRIVIRVGRELGQGARIEVSDTGTGIPGDELGRVFERFRSGATPGKERSGAGIGLALSRDFVELHGGALTAESELGSGSTFSVILPKPSSADPAPPVVAVAAAQGDRAHVLVVEDDPDLRDYLQGILSRRFAVSLAVDGLAGLEKAREEVPDIIVSDVMMPGMDGFEMCERLKNDIRTSHVPVVLLTARGRTESRIEGLSRGADAYMAKPFQTRELEVRLDGLLQNRRRVQEALRVRHIVVGGAGSKDAVSLALDPMDSAFDGALHSEEPELTLSLQSMDMQFLATVKAVIEARFGDAAFEVAELAEQVLLSERQLRRKMQSLTGESPSEAIRRRRLERAAELLRSESATVKEVADAVGFGSRAHFSRSFKAKFGVSPADFGRQEAQARATRS